MRYAARASLYFSTGPNSRLPDSLFLSAQHEQYYASVHNYTLWKI
jgi:hypothetical protein